VTEAEVERLAALLGLPIEPESLAAVAAQLDGLLTVARLLAELPTTSTTSSAAPATSIRGPATGSAPAP